MNYLQDLVAWHISEDLKYFKKITMGAPILMGRKTFESIGKTTNEGAAVGPWCSLEVMLSQLGIDKGIDWMDISARQSRLCQRAQ